MIRPVLKSPDSRLLTACLDVTDFGDSLRQLVRDLIDTLATSKRAGVGLAANQIGDMRRVFIIDLTAGKNPTAIQIFVNPIIRKVRGKEHTQIEGCLSLEVGDDCDVRRATIINWTAQDLHGKPISGRFHDFSARVFQHEMDHLEGRTCLDRKAK